MSRDIDTPNKFCFLILVKLVWLQDLNSDVLDDSAPMRTGLKLRLPPW